MTDQDVTGIYMYKNDLWLQNLYFRVLFLAICNNNEVLLAVTKCCSYYKKNIFIFIKSKIFAEQ